MLKSQHELNELKSERIDMLRQMQAPPLIKIVMQHLMVKENSDKTE